MKIIEYSPEHFRMLKTAAENFSLKTALVHKPFVDFYYFGNKWCKLYIALDNDRIAAVLGIERLKFINEDREVFLGFGTNFHSVEHGAGGVLFMRWMKECQFSLVFGGTEDTHKILRQKKWRYFEGIKTFSLNRKYEIYSSDGIVKSAAKKMLNLKTGLMNSFKSNLNSFIPAEYLNSLKIEEEKTFKDDMLVKKSAFKFRLSPDIEYIRWRYNPELKIVKYRIFRILYGGVSRGAIIINDNPDFIMQAYSDADDTNILSYAMIKCIAQIEGEKTKRREIILTLSNPDMKQIFKNFGFEESVKDGQFALGSIKAQNTIFPETTQWLINYDIGDNGLRVPFLDQR